MTIGTAGARVTLNGDGVSKVFPVAIQAYLNTDFVVILTAPVSAGGGQVLLTLNSDYSLALSGSLQPTQWTLTTLATLAYAVGYTLTVFVSPQQVQQTQYVQGQAFPSLAMQTNLDRLTQMVQRLQDQVTRSPHTPDGDVNPLMLLPPASQRALTNFGFDVNGNLSLGTALAAGTLSRSTIGGFLYPITAAETTLSAVPVDYAYPADPYVDPRRYGADPTAVADSTTALQTAINVAYQAKGMVWISGKYLTGALSLTMTGAANQPLRIVGSAEIGSELIAKAGLSSTSLLKFTTSNPNTTLIQANLQIENLQIRSNSITTGVHGLSIYAIASVTMRNVRVTGFDRGLDLQNVETSTFDVCEFTANNYGVQIQLNGAFFLGMPTPNLLRFNDCIMNLNAKRGVDFNSGTGLYLIGCDVEGNGTAADTTTGGVFIGGQCSPDLGEGHVVIERCWLEANKGWTINVAAQTNGTLLRTVIRGCELIGAESGREVLISGSWVVIMEDLASGSVGDTYNVTCQYGYLSQITVNILTVTGITYPFFSNVQTGTGFQYFGRIESFTVTLTGCTTSPTATAYAIQQGDEITLVMPDLLATSNLNTCTLTGLPAKYQPTAGFIFLPIIVENNSTDTPQMALLSVGSGTITLYQGGSTTGFTSTASSKGVRRQNLKYRLGL